MRRYLLILIIVSLCPGQASGGSVVNSVHNLAAVIDWHEPQDADWNDYNEVCVYCHTPHNSIVNVPLWNRQLSEPTSFTPYTSTTMMATPGLPSESSLLCLSCHDGTTALDAIANVGSSSVQYTSTHSKMDGSCMYCHGSDDCSGSDCHRDFKGTIVGQNLADDHPISIDYIASPSLKPSPEDDGVILINGKVECASCHNVHNPEIWPFMRISNAGSALCYACHDK